MFPISANDPYIKTTGERSTMGKVIGSGGGSDIPAHTEADAGKVLMVNDQGNLVWGTVQGGSSYTRARAIIPVSDIETSSKEVTT